MTADFAQPTSKAADSGHRFDPTRRWAAHLKLGLAHREENGQGVTRLVTRQHQGPLRVQRPFYPEGRDGCCHVYLLHPPGGLVSGDALHIEAELAPNAHALLTTPAANKLYKADSHGVHWSQTTALKVAPGATLEWLPQDTIAFDGSRGQQSTEIALQGDARCLGWEVLVLGRQAGDLPFVQGQLDQRFALTRDGRPLWHERQLMEPQHPRFKGHWGQGSASVQATLWCVGLSAPDQAINALREALPASPRWAVSHRQGVLLLRYLGHDRNEAWSLCQQAWCCLRPLWLGLPAQIPRIWLT